MTKIVHATFDGQVLRPDEPLALLPNTRVVVTIETLEECSASPQSFLKTARSLNLEGPPDWWPKPPTGRVLSHATANLLRDEAESMVPNIDPEQVRKLVGWGLTENDIASFVGCSQSFISLGF